MPIETPSPGKTPPEIIERLLANAEGDFPSDATERARRNRLKRLWKMRAWTATKTAIVLGILAGAVFGGKKALRKGCDCSVAPISTTDR